MPIARTFGVTLAALLAGGLILAACGDDGDSAALSKADFIAAADAICTDANAEQNPILEEAFMEAEAEGAGDVQAFAGVLSGGLEQVEPLMKQQVEDLRDLAPPEEDADEIDEMLDDLEAGMDELFSTVDAAAEGDEEAIAAMQDDSADPLADVNARARAYGFQDCGSGG